MLILTRRTGESLKIGDDIRGTVLGVRGNQIRMGIHAPRKCRFTVKKSITGFTRMWTGKLTRPGTGALLKICNQVSISG